MTLLQHYQLGLQLVGVSSVLGGFWILFQKGSKKATCLFLMYAVMIAVWGFFQAQVGITDNQARSLLWLRTMFLAIIMAPGILMHFFAAILDEKPPRSSWLGLSLLLMFLPFVYSNLFLQPGGDVGFLRSFPRAGPLFLPFILVWIGWVVYALSLLARKAIQKDHPKREEAWFLFVWFSFGYLTGSLNYLYLYGIYLPVIHPFCSHGVSIAWIVLSYGMFAYRTLDARLVIRKSLVYSLLVTTLTIGYFGSVYAIEKLFRSTFGYQSFSVSLTAFALLALAFQPLKSILQRLADWVIFGVPQEELARRMERLEEQALQSEKFKAVSTLAAGMAHEIKNPLTAIQTFAGFIPEKHKDPEFAKKLQEVLTAEAKRMQELVQELLTFAKPKTPQLQPVDLAPLITSTLTLLSSNLSKHQIQWVVDCQHNGAAIHADPDQLRQVLINLIQNAADAMPSGGQLKIATQSVNSHIELTVSDTGNGIPPALLPKIFDPFVTTKPDGNGLGLAMVYSILQAHRGAIRADSEPNHGTTFTVSLPL